ncbi:hypothetical protein TCA2_4615 [Paenibacillus sp. TCA20]|uniref:Uncharacterized protein n=1 Tax=Paenibacillus urinalis TaxID=521520 RepID=A0ABY7XJU0_9BACL|nr:MULTISPECIES: hypothetical protein [Paenibacillus]WDI05051.1 hypothetical protein PUW25_26135 [Paenibacillus urinalis]GAK42123.1 hypothetical protein TCA2_4615 [Paenibacillus sp. TCA20]
MSTMMNFNENTMIAGVATLDCSNNLNHFPLELRLKEITERDNYVVAGNLIVPSKFFNQIVLCNREMYSDLTTEDEEAVSGDN